MAIALTNARLVDGHGGPSIPNSSVIIDGGKIAEIRTTTDLDPTTDVFDVGGRVVMPGLIDSHIHFAGWGSNLLANKDRSLMYLAAKTVKALEGALRRGCTSARDPGGLEAGFREAVNDGTILGPRLQTSLVIISPVNGIHDRTTAQGIQNPSIQGMPNAVCEGHGPDAVRTKVREVLRAGADFIKIAMTGGVSSSRISPKQRVFTQAEVDAVVDEAHAFGVPVVCHALGGPGVLMAVQAGVDTIEHGCYLDDETVEAMADRGTWYVPTFTVYRNHRTLGPEFKQVRARALEQHHQDSFDRARRAGVRIAMGSDAGGYNHDFALELECLVQAGMTPIEAITTGTKMSAECLGLEDCVGTLEAGKDADIVVASADCLDDIRLLREPRNLHMIVQQGQIIKKPD